MELTRKQQEGLKIAVERYRHHEKYTCISGYAGTGKSTLVQFIISALPNIDPELDVKYIAYTGKAATVLKNKGCPGATTAHKLLYEAKLFPDGRYRFFPRQELENKPLVIVVDEISMLPKKMWDLLCRYNVYILACGDPQQLPPVSDNPKEDVNNHVLDHPHVFLDEIMRQAAESEIIRFSMHIRENRPLHLYTAQNKEVMFLKKSQMTDDVLLWADQCLCATNKTCGILNTRMRQSLGFCGDPQLGDKLINRHNEWETLSNKGNPLTNGIIGTTIGSISKSNIEYPGWIRGQTRPFNIPIMWCNITGDEDGEIFSDLMIDYNYINGKEESLNGKEKYLVTKRKGMIPLTFTYGYGITVWKAQGSQWNKVLLIAESWPKDKDLYKRYLYTGCTRAIDRLVVIE